MKHNIFLRSALAFGLAVFAASCTKENSLKPETIVKSDDWQEVSSSEGMLEKNDITIEFPAGTFKDGEKVAISTVKQGLVGGEREVSEFYQVTLPKTGTSKPSEIIINCPEASADKIQQTLVHETSHAVQEFSYDPRTAPVRNAARLPRLPTEDTRRS